MVTVVKGAEIDRSALIIVDIQNDFLHPDGGFAHIARVEHNYRMILVSDADGEVSREAHHAELRTMDRLFADVRSTDEIIELIGGR
jgi:nicotinamidase-related amidase